MPKHVVRGLVVVLWLAPPHAAIAQDGVSDTVQAFLVSSTPMAIAYMLSVTAMKITAFVIGYLVVRLGHDTLIKGVSGEIDFGIKGSGIDAKLKAASPGTFFVLAGAAIIIWGLFVDKPIDLKLQPADAPSPAETAAESSTGGEDEQRPLRRQPIE